jgi:hypothetical protein
MTHKRQSPISGALTLLTEESNIGMRLPMDVIVRTPCATSIPHRFLPSRRTSVIPVGSRGTPEKELWPYSAAGNFAVVSGLSTAPQSLTGRAETHRDIPPGVSGLTHGCGLAWSDIQADAL